MDNTKEQKRQALKDEYIEHIMHPKNYGVISDYSGKGIGNNPNNNELVELYIKVQDEKLQDMKYQAIGCTTTIAGASIFTDMITGESLEEAISVSNQVLQKLETAPAEERACGEMVIMAFLASVKNYENRKNSDEKDYTMNITNDCPTEEITDGK